MSTPLDISDDNRQLIDNYINHLRYERALASSSCATYRRLLQQTAAAIADNLLACCRQDLQDFLDNLRWRGLHGKSVRQYRSVLRGFYQFHVNAATVSSDPSDLLRVAKINRGNLPKAFSVDEINALLTAPTQVNAISWRDYTIAELFYATGLRLSELVAIDNKNVKSDTNQLLITGKGAKQRIVYLGDKARRAICKWQRWRSDLMNDAMLENALFVNVRGQRLQQRGVQYALIRHAKKTLPGRHIHPHMLRHSYASHILQSSQNIRLVQELLGHQKIATTQIYTHLDSQHLQQAYFAAHPRAKKINDV